MKRKPCNCADDMNDAKVYRKIETIYAVQMDRDFLVKTPHGIVKGRKGDYKCSNMKRTDYWPVKKEIFKITHRLADETKQSSTKPT